MYKKDGYHEIDHGWYVMLVSTKPFLFAQKKIFLRKVGCVHQQIKSGQNFSKLIQIHEKLFMKSMYVTKLQFLLFCVV